MRFIDEIFEPIESAYKKVMRATELFEQLELTLRERIQGDAMSSYVAKLHAGGLDAILKKIGEESTEVVMAAKDGNSEHVIKEIADLWFHTLVLLAEQGLSVEQVISELDSRQGISGIEEKASRKTNAQS